MATRTSRAIRSGVIGFVAGVAALGVAASAQPVHDAVASAVGVGPRLDRERPDAGRAAAARDARPQGDGSLPQDQGQDDWSLPQDQGQDGWSLPQDPAPQQPYVQPAPQQAPQSQAS